MKTTSTSDSGNSHLTASGAAAAINSSTTFVHEIPQSPEPHGQARVNVGGTFSGATTKAEGLSPSGTLWIPLLMISNAGARSVGSDAPADSTNSSWVIDVRGFAKIRVYNSAGTITSMKVEVTTGTESEFGGPLANFSTYSTNTFTAGSTYSGGTGVNVVSVPDNLASAWSVNEGSNKYIEVISTDSGEKFKIHKNTILLDGITVVNSANVTGTSIWGASDKGGFFGATPVVKQATFTQTYSTASTTVAAATSHAITDSSGGSASTSALAAQTLPTALTHSVGTADATVDDVGASFNQTTLNNNFKEITVTLAAVRAQLVVLQNATATLAAEATLTKADVLSVAKNVNSLIDALQAYGLVG